MHYQVKIYIFMSLSHDLLKGLLLAICLRDGGVTWGQLLLRVKVGHKTGSITVVRYQRAEVILGFPKVCLSDLSS